MSWRPEKTKEAKAPPETDERGDDPDHAPRSTSTTSSLTSAFSGKLSAELDWKDGVLVGIRISGKSPGLGEDVSLNTTSVFHVEGKRDKLTLTRDLSAIVAREKRSAAGAPTYIELDHAHPAASAPSWTTAKTTVRLKWQDHTLVDVRVGGAFPHEVGRPASMRRQVFKSENSGDQVILAADPSACPAWAEFSENGLPTHIELQHGTGDVPGNASPRSHTVISFDWKDGTLAGVRIRGDFHGEADPAIPERRVFRVRQRENEVSLAAEAPGGQDERPRQVVDLNRALHAIDKAVRSVNSALHAIDKTARSVEKKVDTLDVTLRQDIFNVASGVIGAVWRAQREPNRVDAALPLVLIAQIHRSGGTLLARLFDGHPEVFAFPQELIWRGDEKDTKYSWPDIDPSAEGPLRLAKRLVETSLANASTYNLFGYEKVSSTSQDQRLPFQWSQWAYVETFLEAWQAKAPRSRRECLDIFMTAYFSAFLDWRGSREPKKLITAFKTRMNFIQSHPENEAFFDDYPDGMMISICRHPADWCASATHAGEKYASTDDAMAVWRESAEGALQLKDRHPNHVVLVSFERLVTDPAKAMRWLADRIGLTWNSILAVPTFNGMLVASNSSFDSAVGIDPSVLQRRNTLPTRVREQIERDNLPLYQRFVATADI